MDDSGEFAQCRCGKERPVRTDARLGEHTMRRLAEMTACRACEADLNREMDSCPETIPLPNGVSACSLTWHHTGRCQPYPEMIGYRMGSHSGSSEVA